MVGRACMISAGLAIGGGALAQPAGDPWPAAREVLTARCVECHGGEHRRSGLSFASAETLAEGGDRGAVLDPDDPDASRLLHVIGYANPDLAMPPDGQLPEAELAALRAWVHAGAPWGEGDELADPSRHARSERDALADLDWWSYQPLDEGARELARTTPNEHPIDTLIARELAGERLDTSGPALPEQLLRRASFDVTGLPPTPELVEWFASACARDADAAWSELMDRLLASPAYGEHWARHWLDQVRYAETNGYERDGRKTNIWRYRDWVIRALNDDMPYDRFVIEQLAGDELADFAPELIDGAHAEDRARLATGYYRLGVWDDEPSDPAQARADELADIVDTTGQVFLGMTMGCARCHDHKADPITQRDYFALTAYFNNITGYGGGSFGQHLGGGMTAQIADPPGEGQLTPEARDAAIEEAKHALAAEVAALDLRPAPHRVLLADARAEGVQWRYLTGNPPEDWFRQGFDDSGWSVGAGGFGTADTPGARVGTEWASERITIRARFRVEEVPDGAILSMHHDEDAEVYLNGVHVASLRGYRRGYTDLQLSDEALHALVVGSNTLAITCRQTGGGQYIDAGVRTGWLDDIEGWSTRLGSDPALSGEAFDAPRALVARIERLRAAPVADAYPALVVTERGREAPAQHVHLRGSAHAEGDEVAPSVPSALAWAGEPSLPEPAPDARSTGRRLALARWLVGPAQDVTARVAANRVWQFHFGRGLCRTSGDFGRLGETPTHPELLDYLAAYLIEQDWSLKALHRHIMSSRFYRTSSVASAAALEHDPRNDLYARTDPRRLTGEQFRDAVLAVSGLANDTMYGPSAFPPLPEEVLATASRPGQAWGDAAPGDAGRRSIYVHAKRSLREPLLENLDQPDPDRSCPVRFPTNVPTQSLITLNGAFTNTAAAALGERLARETETTEDAVRHGVLLALGREADPGEVERALAFLDDLRTEHALDDREALRVYALLLFNLNEFMWVD